MTAQIDPIDVPWLMIGQELPAAPEGGYRVVRGGLAVTVCDERAPAQAR